MTTVKWEINTGEEIQEFKSFEMNVEDAKDGHALMRKLVKRTMQIWRDYKHELSVKVSCNNKQVEENYQKKAERYIAKLLNGAIKL